MGGYINNKPINNITVCREDYKTEEDFRNAIRDTIMVLLNNGYIMTVNYDDKAFGIVAIYFEYADISLGCPYPFWLSEKEEESIIWDKEE